MRTIALETFRIIHKTSPGFLHNLITIKENSYNFRYKNTAVLSQPRTERYGKKALALRQQDYGTPYPMKLGRFHHLALSKILFPPGVSQKIALVALVDNNPSLAALNLKF